VVVVGFALINLAAAASSLAPGLFTGGGSGPAAHTISSNVQIADGVQVVSMTQDGGYHPANSVVYAGMPVRWVIDSRSIGCDSSLQVPSLGIDGLKPGRNEFRFTPAKSGRTGFACAMGMYRGSITAIPAPAAAATPAAVSP
jgi:plastocyanin domain-containing protein